MKKATAVLCATLLAFSMPAAAFGEEVEEVSDSTARVETRAVENNLGAEFSIDGSNVTYSLEQGNVSWGGIVEGTLTKFELKFKDITNLTHTGPNAVEAPTPYAVDGSKTVLNAIAFEFNFFLSHNLTLSPTGTDGSIEFIYQANQDLVKKLAQENGITPEDIDLFIYVQNIDGQVTQLGSGPAASALSVPHRSLESSTFVMALACDTSLLNSRPNLVLTAGGGWIPPEASPMVATETEGEDDSATSPKTGQSIPAETAPAALLVTVALGTAAALTARRKRVR